MTDSGNPFNTGNVSRVFVVVLGKPCIVLVLINPPAHFQGSNIAKIFSTDKRGFPWAVHGNPVRGAIQKAYSVLAPSGLTQPTRSRGSRWSQPMNHSLAHAAGRVIQRVLGTNYSRPELVFAFVVYHVRAREAASILQQSHTCFQSKPIQWTTSLVTKCIGIPGQILPVCSFNVCTKAVRITTERSRKA